MQRIENLIIFLPEYLAQEKGQESDDTNSPNESKTVESKAKMTTFEMTNSNLEEIGKSRSMFTGMTFPVFRKKNKIMFEVGMQGNLIGIVYGLPTKLKDVARKGFAIIKKSLTKNKNFQVGTWYRFTLNPPSKICAQTTWKGMHQVEVDLVNFTSKIVVRISKTTPVCHIPPLDEEKRDHRRSFIG